MNAVIEFVPVATADPTPAPGKKGIGEVRPSQAYNLGFFVRYAVWASVFVAAYAFAPWDVPVWVLMTPLVILALLAAFRWLDLACVSYRFEGGERIVWSWGILSRNTGSLEVFRVQNVTMHQSFLERLAGVGTVVLETRDETNPVMRLIGMSRPEDLRGRLTEYVQKARRERGVQEAAVN